MPGITVKNLERSGCFDRFAFLRPAFMYVHVSVRGPKRNKNKHDSQMFQL